MPENRERRNRGPFRAIDTLRSFPIYQVQWHFSPPLLAPAPKHGRYFFLGGNKVLPTVFCRMQLLSRYFFLLYAYCHSLKCFRLWRFFKTVFCGNSGNPLSVGANSQIFQPCDTFLPQDRWYNPPLPHRLKLSKPKKKNVQITKKSPYKFCVCESDICLFTCGFFLLLLGIKNRSILFFCCHRFPVSFSALRGQKKIK